MALLDAKCTNCGAALKVNGGLDAANCEFCGAAFVVEKAVQNFHVNIQAQHESVQAPSSKSKTGIALVCGVFSCIIPFLFLFMISSDNPDARAIVWALLLIAIVMSLSLVGIVLGKRARKTAVVVFSVIGFIPSAALFIFYLIMFIILS